MKLGRVNEGRPDTRRGLTRHERVIAGVNLAYISAFTILALRRENYEFVMYAGVVVLIFALILAKQPVVRFDRVILWGLSLWGLAHMAGGNIGVGDGVLYSVQLIPRILRYDQLVHWFGFGTATLVCFHLLRPRLREEAVGGAVLWFLVIMMGIGVGALNEVIEFASVLSMPETGVGGYENTLWDLVFNTLGAVTAVVVIAVRDRVSSRRGGRIDR
jgi:uncharacterized membrane protein YjdF